MRNHAEHPRDLDEDEDLTTQVPTAPNRDLGTGGTKEVDTPPNTDDLGSLGEVPEAPD